MKEKNMSKNEYFAFTQYVGMLSTLLDCEPDLEMRLKTIPGGWRDFRCCIALMDKLLTPLLKTIPADKRLRIKRDMQTIRCTYQQKKPDFTQARLERMQFCNDDAIENIVRRVMAFECVGCEKRDNEVRACPLRHDLDGLYPWDMPFKGGNCPLAGFLIERDDSTDG